MKSKSPILFLILFSSLFSYQIVAQERFNQISEERRALLLFHELNLIQGKNDSLTGDFYFRISHNFISFLREENENSGTYYTAKIKLNIEVHFADSSIVRYSDNITKTINEYEATQNRYEYMTGKIRMKLKSKPVYYTLDGVDVGNGKVLFGTARKQNISKFDIPSLLDYHIADQINEPVNLSKNFAFNLDQSIILIVSDSTGISKWVLSLTRKKIADDEFEPVNDFDPIKLTALEKSEKSFRYRVEIPSLKMEAGSYKLGISANGKKAEIAFQNLWLDSPMALKDLDLATRVVRYIATADEYDELTSGSFETRVNKFKTFWKKKDPTPNTVYNELMTEYFRRVDYAYMNFQSLKEYGWRTDRGKIYILYGEPTSKQRVFPPGEPSEEIWIYAKLNKRFVFSDSDGKGTFRLNESNTN